MTKSCFMASLREKLSHLPRQDVEERLMFYSEMIDDRMEEGLSEEDAVSDTGSVEEIATQIEADITPSNPIKEKIKPKRKLKTWEIVLLALGSPIWVSLLIATFAVVISLYVSLWSVIISLWAVFGSFTGVALGGIGAGITLLCLGNVLSSFAMIGAGFICAGLSIFMFYGCKAATDGTLLLTKKIIKKCFGRKERAS